MDKINIWITSTGRYTYLKPTIDSFLQHNTYPNIEFLIVESVPTEESKKYFNTPLIETEKCIEYVKSLDIPKKHFILPWDLFGKTLNKLLSETEGFYVSLEDDCSTVCDPKDQFIDGIKLLENDPQLLGLRMDLRDPRSVYPNSTRFKGTKMNFGMDYVYWDIYAGGAQLNDANKIRKIGGFCDTHSFLEYGETEWRLQDSMIKANMYCGVNCKYYGFLIHHGALSTKGTDKQYSYDAYEEMYRKGWYGTGQDIK